MSEVLQLLVNLDQDAVRATGELRWEPATAVLAVASAWWRTVTWCLRLKALHSASPNCALVCGRW